METIILTKKQKRKQKLNTLHALRRKTIRFLMSSGKFTILEARHITKSVPLVVNLTRPPIPVRMTVLRYPDNFISSTTNDGHFEQVQQFIVDAVQRRNAPPIVSFVCISGYIIVLTEHRGSEQFVRGLMAELWNQGTCLREPTSEEVEKFHETRYPSGLPKPKPSSRCTREEKNWREYLTGQKVVKSESEDSDSEEEERG